MIGKTIGNVKIESQIGQGGMGTVYKGYQANLDRWVAVKVISAHLSSDQELIKRFRREALSIAKLNHPNLVSIYDFIEEEGIHAIIMEYIEGKNLKQQIKEGKNFEPFEIAKIMIEVANGLWHAHKHDPPIIHRDIKGENIMITPQGGVKIMDFGTALMAGGTFHTKTGMTIGTPEYMSPEQVRGLKIDYRTDLYSLGAVMYELLAGQLPFRARNMFDVARKQVVEIPIDPKCFQTDLPEDIVKICLKALEKDRNIRYQSAGQLIADLEAFLRNAPVSAEPSYKPSSPEHIITVKPVKVAEDEKILSGPDKAIIVPEIEPIPKEKPSKSWTFITIFSIIMLVVLSFLLLKMAKTEKEIPFKVENVTALSGDNPGEIIIFYTIPKSSESKSKDYVIRYDTKPITEASWTGLSKVPNHWIKKSNFVGRKNTLTLSGIPEGIKYYFAVRNEKSGEEYQPLSNVSSAMAKPYPPGAVRNFNVIARGRTLKFTWDATGDDGYESGAAVSYRLMYSTNIISASNINEALAIPITDLEALAPGEIMEWNESSFEPGEYYFAIQGVDDLGETSIPTTSLKIRVSEEKDITPPEKIDNLEAEPGSMPGSVILTWISPEDSESIIQVYDIRKVEYKKDSPVVFDNAVRIINDLQPQKPGESESWAVYRLSEGQAYAFGIRSQDQSGNWSEFSEPVIIEPELIPPNPVFDLVAEANPLDDKYEIVLKWTATGDDGDLGMADHYLIYYGNKRITESSIKEVSLIPASPPKPALPGTMQTVSISIDDMGRYYFAMKVFDDMGSQSSLSNNAVCQLIDVFRPSPIEGFKVKAGGKPNEAVLSWKATGDNGKVGKASDYDLRMSRTSVTGDEWSSAERVLSGKMPEPKESGTNQSVIISDLNEKRIYYFGLSAIDKDRNRSAWVDTSVEISGVPQPPKATATQPLPTFTSNAQQPSPTSMPEKGEDSPKESISKCLAEYEDAINKKDWNRINKCWHPAIDFSVRLSLNNYYNEFGTSAKTRFVLSSSPQVSGNTAFAMVKKEITTPDNKTLTSNELFKWKYIAGTWKIVEDF